MIRTKAFATIAAARDWADRLAGGPALPATVTESSRLRGGAARGGLSRAVAGKRAGPVPPAKAAAYMKNELGVQGELPASACKVVSLNAQRWRPHGGYGCHGHLRPPGPRRLHPRAAQRSSPARSIARTRAA